MELLPYKNKPLDLYRSPMWHAEYDENKRSPHAAIKHLLVVNLNVVFV